MDTTPEQTSDTFVDEDTRGTGFVPNYVEGKSVRSLLGAIDIFVVLLFAIMTLSAVISVLGRAFPTIAISNMDQMLPDMLVWLSLLGGAAAIGSSEHLGVSYFVDKAKPAFRTAAQVLVLLALLMFFGAVLYGGIHSVTDQFQRGISSPAGYPIWLVQLALPVGAIVSILFLVLKEIRNLMSSNNKTGRTKGVANEH